MRYLVLESSELLEWNPMVTVTAQLSYMGRFRACFADKQNFCLVCRPFVVEWTRSTFEVCRYMEQFGIKNILLKNNIIYYICIYLFMDGNRFKSMVYIGSIYCSVYYIVSIIIIPTVGQPGTDFLKLIIKPIVVKKNFKKTSCSTRRIQKSFMLFLRNHSPWHVKLNFWYVTYIFVDLFDFLL